MKVVTLSFDVEEFDFPLERGMEIDFTTQIDISTEGLVPLLALLKKYSIQATFYVTATYALNKPELVCEMAQAGHEMASHDYYHGENEPSDPLRAKTVLEEITNMHVYGYRAPRMRKVSSDELINGGYVYNSSMNPTCIPSRYNNLRKPRNVFRENGIIQYPLSVSYPFRIPLFWLSLHVMGLRLYQSLAKSAMKKDNHLNLYFHPWEFSDNLADQRFNVPAYISNCSGTKLLHKLELLIRFLNEMGYCFQTTKQYLGING